MIVALVPACAGAVLLALEDLHWADDLSLEVLDRVARRLATLPMLVIGTYRSDELYPRAPMRVWRSRLLNQRLAGEARLARLSPEETAAMAGAIADTVLPTAVTAAVHGRSDGIPLHVEEILAFLAGPDAARRSIHPRRVPPYRDRGLGDGPHRHRRAHEWLTTIRTTVT